MKTKEKEIIKRIEKKQFVPAVNTWNDEEPPSLAYIRTSDTNEYFGYSCSLHYILGDIDLLEKFVDNVEDVDDCAEVWAKIIEESASSMSFLIFNETVSDILQNNRVDTNLKKRILNLKTINDECFDLFDILKILDIIVIGDVEFRKYHKTQKVKKEKTMESKRLKLIKEAKAIINKGIKDIKNYCNEDGEPDGSISYNNVDIYHETSEFCVLYKIERKNGRLYITAGNGCTETLPLKDFNDLECLCAIADSLN